MKVQVKYNPDCLYGKKLIMHKNIFLKAGKEYEVLVYEDEIIIKNISLDSKKSSIKKVKEIYKEKVQIKFVANIPIGEYEIEEENDDDNQIIIKLK